MTRPKTPDTPEVPPRNWGQELPQSDHLAIFQGMEQVLERARHSFTVSTNRYALFSADKTLPAVTLDFYSAPSLEEGNLDRPGYFLDIHEAGKDITTHEVSQSQIQHATLALRVSAKNPDRMRKIVRGIVESKNNLGALMAFLRPYEEPDGPSALARLREENTR